MLKIRQIVFYVSHTTLSFALFGNVFQTKKSSNIREVISNILDMGGKIMIEREFAAFLKNNTDLNVDDYEQFEHIDNSVDFALSIGGDGTFLKTAQQVVKTNIPVVGINTGRLGFISEVTPYDSRLFFENLFSGKYWLEERSLLQCSFDGENQHVSPFALNEIAVLKHDISSMIDISTYVNGKYLATYLADGLVVSTPTGSTAYSLSVGGPIVSPDSKSIIISPVAAHSLSIRPLVLNDSVKIRLEVKSRSNNFMVAIDGRSTSFQDTTTMEITKAPYSINIVRSMDHSFFDTLRNKMLWGADKR